MARNEWSVIDNSTSEIVFTGNADECMGWLWMGSEPFGDYSVAPVTYDTTYMPDDPNKVR